VDNETQFISLNFSTAYENGLLVWTAQVPRTQSCDKITRVECIPFSFEGGMVYGVGDDQWKVNGDVGAKI